MRDRAPFRTAGRSTGTSASAALLCPADPPSAGGPAVSSRLAGGGPPPYRVLVAEDEQIVRDLVVEVLEINGFEVEAFENGARALERLRSTQRFDLLFTDIVMPDGPDGVELACLARALRPELRVLLSSGYSRHILMNRETAKENTRFLSKPYRLAQMLEAVAELLGDRDDAH